VVAFALVWLGTPLTTRGRGVTPTRSHGRPYFTPPSERARILDLIRDEPGLARNELAASGERHQKTS
jgi:hypothetical protein